MALQTGNLALDLASYGIDILIQLIQVVAVAYVVITIAGYIMTLLKGRAYRDTNRSSYKDWLDTCKRHKDANMVNLVVAGTKGISTRPIGKIDGFNEVQHEPPTKSDFPRTKEGERAYAKRMTEYKKMKSAGLVDCYVFAARKWWHLWKPHFLYMIPKSMVIDDVLAGDILVNVAGFLPVCGLWMVPSNVNRKYFADVIKTNSVYVAYEQDWKYIGNIAERAVEADNQYLKFIGGRNQAVNVFKGNKGGDKQ